MTESTGPAMRLALEAALRGNGPIKNLGLAVWLYLMLVLAANDRGLVIRTRDQLAGGLSAAEGEIDTWLSQLSGSGLIKIKSPPPYLVISLRFWSGSAPQPAFESGADSGESGHAMEDVPVSSKLPAAEQGKKSGDGGTGEGEALLAEARAVLGETDTAELPGMLDSYPRPIVRRALQRVGATPERQIRKSRVALFRFLLTKFSEETHVQPSTHHPDPGPPAP